MQVILLLILLLYYNLASAVLPQEGWYIGPMIGPSFASDLDFSLTNPLTGQPADGKLHYATGLNGGGQIGYRYDKFRFEGQILFNQNTFSQVDVANLTVTSGNPTTGLGFTGHTQFFAAMFNVFWELYPADREIKMLPYLGIGGGYAQINNTLQIYNNTRQILSRQASAGAPMGQLIGGLSYFFNDRFYLAADYRYMTTPQHEELNSTVSTQSINVLFNFSLI